MPLAIERWLVFGGSWGSTLALAYAEAITWRLGADDVGHAERPGAHRQRAGEPDPRRLLLGLERHGHERY